jgi:hypothetical protein
MAKSNLLYKYKSFSATSLSMLINRALYFASPEQLNDPNDCRINIVAALESAVELAEQSTNENIKQKLEKLHSLDHIFKQIEQDIQRTGIFSLSHLNKNILMWSHYADEHRGFCLGFRLSEKFIKFTKGNMQDLIVACDDVEYVEENPFINYFINIAKETNNPEWEDFWPPLLQIGLQSKSKPWRYEKEIRVIRKEPGAVSFTPEELVEVIFGLNMSDENQLTIWNLLSGPEWKHVRFKKMIRKGHNFNLYLEKYKR